MDIKEIKEWEEFFKNHNGEKFYNKTTYEKDYAGGSTCYVLESIVKDYAVKIAKELKAKDKEIERYKNIVEKPSEVDWADLERFIDLEEENTKLKELVKELESKTSILEGSLRTCYDAWSFSDDISYENEHIIEQLLKQVNQ